MLAQSYSNQVNSQAKEGVGPDIGRKLAAEYSGHAKGLYPPVQLYSGDQLHSGLQKEEALASESKSDTDTNRLLLAMTSSASHSSYSTAIQGAFQASGEG